MKMFLLATSALLAAYAAPAFAQDAADAPAPAPTSAPSDGASFAGPRAEIFGGWDRVGARTRFNDGTTSYTDHEHKTGGTAGALIGYDMPIGSSLIAGVFGSYALSTAKACGYTATTIACIKPGREIEGGARVGYKLGGKALVYAKGAYVNGQLRETAGDDSGDYFRERADRDGWRAGAGVEYALNRHAYVKAEYDYTRFKSINAADFGEADTNVRFDRNQVLGGFGIRF